DHNAAVCLWWRLQVRSTWANPSQIVRVLRERCPQRNAARTRTVARRRSVPVAGGPSVARRVAFRSATVPHHHPPKRVAVRDGDPPPPPHNALLSATVPHRHRPKFVAVAAGDPPPPGATCCACRRWSTTHPPQRIAVRDGPPPSSTELHCG